MKFFLKKISDQRGTALLVAMLVMGILVTVSMALSAIVFRELNITVDLIDSGKAYYAAESAVEEALYYLDNELPGWSANEALGKVGDNGVFEYSVKNACNSYPCFPEDEYDYNSMFAYNFYAVLDLNESIVIPLFTINEEGQVEAVKDFTVEFFANFNPKTDLNLATGDISGWDVLRWKVFGMKKVDDGSFQTEALHDFTAVSSYLNTETGEDVVTNAGRPSWFGSKKCESTLDGKIECSDYAFTAYSEDETACSQTEARDYYLYSGGEFENKVPCYSIGQFMLEHQSDSAGGATGLNYLSLTNMMNPLILKDDKFNNEQKREASKIYFRVETYDDKVPREYAEINADGYSGDSKQSIEVRVKRDSYMPVFNFSIYSTYKTGGSKFYGKFNDPNGG